MSRKWLTVIFLAMLGGASVLGLPPKDVEDTLRVMNETKIEFAIPDRDNHGEGGPDGYRSLIRMEDTGSETPSGFAGRRAYAK